MASRLQRHVGPYRILGTVGRGGMSEVLRGEHPRTGELVAIKTVAQPRGDLAAIRREIHALRRLQHPGIVPILDDGVTDEGLPWMAMPLLAGPTLADHIAALRATPPAVTPTAGARTAPMTAGTGAPPRVIVAPEPVAPPLRATLTLIHRLCAPLAFLHGKHLVHRDLKPANVVLRDGRPVLIDLGIATQFGSAHGRDALTVEQPYGSIQYMAPEQIRGDLVDARADLYALGCILYECLTGRPPFDGASAEVIAARHRSEEPVLPSRRVPGLPAALDPLVSQLLAKDPRDRIGHASGVAAALVALGAEAEQESGPQADAYLYPSALVGRDGPLATLKQAMGRVVAQHRGGLVLVHGESGTGKTRLAREIARLATRQIEVLAGSCESPGTGESGKALDPLREVLQAAVDRARESRTEADRLFGARGGVLARYVPELLRLPGQSQQPAPVALPPLEGRARVLEALRETLWALSDEDPILVVLDDIQWADELTIGLIEVLARGGLAERPVLLVATYRIEETRPELSALSRLPGAHTLALDRLDAEAIGSMVANMLAQPLPPRGVLQALVDCSNGNPLFVAAYLRAAIDQGILHRDETGNFCFEARAGAAVSSLPLPNTLAALLDARIDRLDPGARALLAWAAVLGREPSTDLLISGARHTPSAALEALEVLRVRQILEESGRGRMRFVHDKIREIAYQQLTDAQRADLHRQAGEALEARYGETPARAQILGHHFAQAGLHEKAGRYFARAAEHAREVYANGDAVRFFRAAIDAFTRVAGDHGDRARLAPLHEGLGDVLELIGRHDEARDAYQAALAMTLPAQHLEAARLCRRIGKTLEMQHHHERALDAYARAEAALGETPGADAWWQEWLEIQHHRVSVLYWLADIEGVSALVDAIGPVVMQHGGALERGRYFHAMTQRDLQVERYLASAETVLHARACVAAFEAAGEAPEGYWSLYAQTALATVLILHGDLEEAHERMTSVLHVAERTGDFEAQTRCLTYLAMIHRRSCRTIPGRHLVERSLSLARANHVHEYVGAALGNLAWDAITRGDLAGAERAGREALAC